MNAYGWAPDAWTLFENAATGETEGKPDHEMVAILAFDYGD